MTWNRAAVERRIAIDRSFERLRRAAAAHDDNAAGGHLEVDYATRDGEDR